MPHLKGVQVAPWIVVWKIESENFVRKSSLSPILKGLVNLAGNSAPNFTASLRNFAPGSVPIRLLRNGERKAVFRRPTQRPKAPPKQPIPA
jgi:hypothetical protein